MVKAALRPVSAVARSFSPASMPLMTRRNYRWELSAALFLPAAIACVDGNMLGVIAEKSFNAPAFVIATLGATTPLANITSAFWTKTLHGTHRVHAINLIQILLLACVAAIALAPVNNFGLAILVIAALMGRVFMTGIMNARSDVWRANYPRNHRARLTGKLTTLNALIIGVASVAVGVLMDQPDAPPNAFRWFFFAAIASGILGTWCFSHIRWRGGPAQQRAERRKRDASGSSIRARDMINVLKQDKLYRKYMVAQFILGISNLAAFPVFIVALGDKFELGYTASLTLAVGIPITMPIITIPFWARLLDRVHIITFRVFHSWVFVIANLLLGVGFLTQDIWIITAARVTLGIAFGGGMLAWNLGHHDFASREMASIYMGIHATLTGVRGAIGPYIGALLYTPVAFTIPVIDASLDWSGMGAWTFIILAIAGTIGALLFLRLYLEHQKLHPAHPSDN